MCIRDRLGGALVCELDEQWSYVGKKSQPRWLWYAWSPHFKRVIAYAFGRRTDETLALLLLPVSYTHLDVYKRQVSIVVSSIFSI